MKPFCLALLAALWSDACPGAGPTLVVELPAQFNVASAVATARSLKLDSPGVVGEGKVTFANLLPDTPYDIRLTLNDGTVLTGVDLSWYNEEQAKPDAGELADDDREQIRALVQDVRQFYDRSEILQLTGDHDRAVALVQQIRDSAFHSDKGGEVIWRLEIWYFKNRHGGWERISQQNKVLDRQRFAGKADYQRATARTRWLADLGGVRIPRGEDAKTLRLRPPSPAPATAAAEKPKAAGPPKDRN
jgi:hypothetical protein